MGKTKVYIKLENKKDLIASFKSKKSKNILIKPIKGLVILWFKDDIEMRKYILKLSRLMKIKSMDLKYKKLRKNYYAVWRESKIVSQVNPLFFDEVIPLNLFIWKYALKVIESDGVYKFNLNGSYLLIKREAKIFGSLYFENFTNIEKELNLEVINESVDLSELISIIKSDIRG